MIKFTPAVWIIAGNVIFWIGALIHDSSHAYGLSFCFVGGCALGWGILGYFGGSR